MPCTVSYSFCSTGPQPSGSLIAITVSPRVISHTGVTTTAVPHAATSANSFTSSNGTGRTSTFMPRSAAICLSVLLVTLGSTECESGVT